MKPLWLVFILAALLSCSSLDERPVYGPVMTPSQAKKLYATTDYQPSYRWIRKNVFKICAYCHPNQYADMFTYDGVSALVEPGMPEQSLLYQQVASGKMPKNKKLANEKIQVIYDWIKDGAKDN